MNKTYSRIVWENYPSDKTPVNERNLNKIDVAVDEMDNRIIVLEETKATKVEVSPLFKEVAYDEQTGIITFTRKNGATVTIDTPMEKIQTGIYYNPITEMLVLPLIDGTSMEVDLSRLMKFDEFIDSDTIAFSVKANGTVTAIVKEESIEEKHLRPDYLADIKTEVAKAQASQQAAATSETNAKKSEQAAKVSQEAAKESENSASESKDLATISASDAARKATEASNSAAAAKTSETNAKTSETNTESNKNSAANSAFSAAASASMATQKSADALNYAKQAQSYAIGTGGVRPNEAADNAKKYYEQCKRISEGFAGALLPMGTVAFINLPQLSSVESGWMYNISDSFVTNGEFKEGVGYVISAGSNVYKTADGYWDVLAGTPVTTVNGQTGNVVISSLPANGGNADTVDGKHAIDLQNYNNLSNKPNIPSVGNGIVTIKQNGANKGSFTMNQSGNTTIELTDNDTTYGLASQLSNGLMSASDKVNLEKVLYLESKSVTEKNRGINGGYNHVVLQIDAWATGWFFLIAGIRSGINDENTLLNLYLINTDKPGAGENYLAANGTSRLTRAMHLQVSGIFYANINTHFKLCVYTQNNFDYESADMQAVLIRKS